jgi:hypothetical protein
MTQSGLIDSIIKDLGLNTTLSKHDKHNTPAKQFYNQTWINQLLSNPETTVL